MAAGERRTPAWFGPALIVAGAAVLAYAWFQFTSIANDPSYTGAGWRDASDMRHVSQGLFLGLALVALGIVQVALRLRERPRTTPAPRQAEKPEKPAAPAPAPAPTPAPAPAPKPKPVRPDGGISPLDQVLPRSDDALATLRYFITNAPDQMLADQLELVRRTGLADWSGEPRCRARRLVRSGRWWLVGEDASLAPADTDRIWAIEAALNLGRDAAHMADPPQTLDERVRVLLAGVSRLEPVRHPGSRFLADLTAGAAEKGEWAVRLAFADALENLPVPFRMVADFRLNVGAGLLGVEAAVPRPAAFAFAPEGERARLACAYAYDLALLLARTAFDASPAIRRVVVSCHEADGADGIISADLTRPTLARMAAPPREDGLPVASAGLRVRRGVDGWLTPVEPFMSLADERLCPRERRRPVELDATPCPEGLLRVCGARKLCDLGIAESAVRWDAWEAIADELGGLGDTTEDAVSALVGLRERTTDPTVAAACGRTARALVSGELDVEDADGLVECFVDGAQLTRAVLRAAPLVSGADPDPDELAAAVDALEPALAEAEKDGAYRDDDRTAYRYFRSVPERVTYNLELADGREVRLVPDALFLAHQYAAMIGRRLGVPGGFDRALAHAERAAELAPCTAEAAITRADCLRDLGRTDEAVRVVSGAAERCSTVDGLSLCLYRLAALVYDLGLVGASVACYRRCIELGRAQAEPARRELALLAEHEREALAASRIDPDKLTGARLARTLEEAGLPTGDVGPIAERLRAAAAACTDAGVFSPARPLLQALLQVPGRYDDALYDVLRSLG